MNFKMLLSLAAVLSSQFFFVHAGATPVTVPNYSFENGLTGWTGTAGSGTYVPTVSNAGFVATDGSSVGYVYGSGTGSPAQEISSSASLVTIAANTTYSLTVSVGQGFVGSSNQGMSGNIALLANGVVISGASHTGIKSTAGTIADYTVSFTTAASGGYIGQSLTVQLGQDAGYPSGQYPLPNFDNVRVNQTSAITVPNFSFESGLSNWAGSGSSGTYVPTVSSAGFVAPNGTNVAYVYGTGAANSPGQEIFSGTTLTTIAANTTYTLTVAVGQGFPGSYNQGISANISILANGVIIPQASLTGIKPAPGTIADYTVSFTTGASGGYIGQALIVQMGQDAGYPAGQYPVPDFDNIRVTTSPAPLNLVTNGDFEVDPISGSSAPIYQIRTSAPTGWLYSGQTGVQGLLSPSAGQPNNGNYNGTPPGFSGNQVAFSYLSSASTAAVLSQNLSATLLANTTYTFSMAVGDRNNGNTWGGFDVAIKTSGGAVAAEWIGANTNFAATDTFGKFTRSFTTGPNPPGLGQALTVSVAQPISAATSVYLDFDNIVLNAAPATTTHTTGTPIDVYIVAGQSNAQGFQANVASLSSFNTHYDTAPDQRVQFCYSQNILGQALYTTGTLAQLSTTGTGDAAIFEGMGPELSAGSDLAVRFGRPLAIIKYAVGGAGLAHDFLKSDNYLYPAFIAQVKSGLAQLTAQGYSPTLKVVFWLQGETDALGTEGASDAGNYSPNIATFVGTVRADLGVPALKFVLTQINPNTPFFSSPTNVETQVAEVNQGMINLAAADSNVQYVTTSDIPASAFADVIHYNADANILIGQRWAAQFKP